ncbi:hypothetical protein ACM66B_003931 [Microbotryomycetes sp. NB124-2]
MDHAQEAKKIAHVSRVRDSITDWSLAANSVIHAGRVWLSEEVATGLLGVAPRDAVVTAELHLKETFEKVQVEFKSRGSLLAIASSINRAAAIEARCLWLSDPDTTHSLVPQGKEADSLVHAAYVIVSALDQELRRQHKLDRPSHLEHRSALSESAETEKFKVLYDRAHERKVQMVFEEQLRDRGGKRLLHSGFEDLSKQAKEMTSGVLFYQVVKAGQDIKHKRDFEDRILAIVTSLSIEKTADRNRFNGMNGALLQTARELARHPSLCNELSEKVLAGKALIHSTQESRTEDRQHKRPRHSGPHQGPALSKRAQRRYKKTSEQLQQEWGF